MKKRIEITISRRHPFAVTACVLMAAAALIRMAYYIPAEKTLWEFCVHLFLPVIAAVHFIIGVLWEGDRFRIPCILSVLEGVVFFVLKAFGFSPVHQILCTVLYGTVMILYTVTVMGYLPTKKLLYPLFGLPFLYHIVVEDTQYYFFADPPVPVWEWLPEISVLCIMAALFCQSAAMKTEPVKETGK